MAALAHKIERRLQRRIILIGAVDLLRPDLFFGGYVPAEAAGPAQALPFDQIGLAAASRILFPLPAEAENRGDADRDEADEASADRLGAALVAALQHETEHGQAGAAERDKNDAAPPQKIGAHQHDDDVEDGMS